MFGVTHTKISEGLRQSLETEENRGARHAFHEEGEDRVSKARKIVYALKEDLFNVEASAAAESQLMKSKLEDSEWRETVLTAEKESYAHSLKTLEHQLAAEMISSRDGRVYVLEAEVESAKIAVENTQKHASRALSDADGRIGELSSRLYQVEQMADREYAVALELAEMRRMFDTEMEAANAEIIRVTKQREGVKLETWNQKEEMQSLESAFYANSSKTCLTDYLRIRLITISP